MEVCLQLRAHGYNILPAKWEGNLHMGGSLNLRQYTIHTTGHWILIEYLITLNVTLQSDTFSCGCSHSHANTAEVPNCLHSLTLTAVQICQIFKYFKGGLSLSSRNTVHVERQSPIHVKRWSSRGRIDPSTWKGSAVSISLFICIVNCSLIFLGWFLVIYDSVWNLLGAILGDSW